MLRAFIASLCLILSGCVILPEFSRQPQLHNPFPQLTKVAVAPFFNLTTEPTLDGRRVALAYFNELQSVPGFEVIPVGVVETAMRENHIELRNPAEARQLAQILKVDAVVIGAVTDYTPYYPPRLALQVEWYAANSGFHSIPAGYGLPWGTQDEKEIPAPLIFEAEFALAREQLKTQTPHQPPGNTSAKSDAQTEKSEDGKAVGGVKNTSNTEIAKSKAAPKTADKSDTVDTVVTNGKLDISENGLPPEWPDARGFIPQGPQATPPEYIPTDAPVLRHTKTYNGHDAHFTTALSTYCYFSDDARFGGWQSYLSRSDDFIRFCCHMHISEMLTARGGAGESKVVIRQQTIR